MEKLDLICLFAHYNQHNKIYGYVFTYLEYLSKLGFQIIFISNSPVSEKYKDDLQRLIPCKIYERVNTGNDFGAWKWAFDNNLIPEDCDGLLLTNDSVFGPLFDMQPIMEHFMTKTDIDFWGLTDCYQGAWHIQSYFLFIRKPVLSSGAFKTFFKQNFETLSKKQIIDNGEISLSQTLRQAGFKGEAYIPYDEFLQEGQKELHNPTHFFWAELIQNYRYPFLKRDLMVSNPENFKNIINAYFIIEEYTVYDVENIKEVVVESKINKEVFPNIQLKPLVLCHVFFPDIALRFIEQLTVLNSYNAFFIFNISAALNKNKHFRDILQRIYPNSIIISTPNKGRDIGGKFSALDLALQLNIESDIVLIIHDKKSQHLESGQLWRDELFKVIDKEFLKKIFEKFEKQQDIGVISSEKFIQNEYDPQTNSFTCSSNSQIKELMKKYDIQTGDYDFVAGNIFWIRTKLLQRFFGKRSILRIRADLESGNALDFNKGTYIHSWERIMSWIATSQGYKIYGI